MDMEAEEKKLATIIERLTRIQDTLDAIDSTLAPRPNAEGRPPHESGIAPTVEDILDRLDDLDQQARRILGNLREIADKLG